MKGAFKMIAAVKLTWTTDGNDVRRSCFFLENMNTYAEVGKQIDELFGDDCLSIDEIELIDSCVIEAPEETTYTIMKNHLKEI